MGARSLPLLILCLACAVPARGQTIHEAQEQSELAWSSPPLPVSTPPAVSPTGSTSRGGESQWTAVGLSLLLPGAGHFYAGAGDRGKIFLGAEAVIWSLALVFDRREAWKSQDAVDYAVTHAELDPTGKDDEFLERLEFYQNRDEYNTAGRILDPTRPYLPPTPDTYWQWDDTTSREAYRDLRNSAETASRNRTFAFYAALLNRVVAAVDAFRIAHGNKVHSKQEGLKVSLESDGSPVDPRILVHARLSF